MWWICKHSTVYFVDRRCIRTARVAILEGIKTQHLPRTFSHDPGRVLNDGDSAMLKVVD